MRPIKRNDLVRFTQFSDETRTELCTIFGIVKSVGNNTVDVVDVDSKVHTKRKKNVQLVFG